MTQTWQQMGEEQLRLHGLGLAELNRIDQHLRQERGRLSQVLEVRHRELAVLTHQTSRLLYKKAENIQRLERRRRMTEVGLEVVIAYGQGETGAALLARLLDTVKEAAGAETVAVFALSEGILKLMALRGLHAEAFTEVVTTRLGEGVCGLAAKRKQPVVATVLPQELRFLRSKPDRTGFTCFAAIPLLAGEELVGAVEVAATTTLTLAPSELKILIGLGSLVRASLADWETKRAVETFHQLELRTG